MAKRSYPAIPRASINDDVRAITEILEIGLGIKGQALDKFLTWNDLINKGLVQLLPDKIGSKGITETAIDNTIPVIEPPDLTTPPTPTGFAVYDGIRSISLTWNDPKALYSNHAFTEVWRHDADNIANAVLVSRVTGLSYTDELQSVSTQQYYWIRFVSDADVVGPFNSATGTAGATVGVITAFLTGTVGFANLESTLSSTITQNTTDVSSLKGQYSVKIDANGFVNGFGLYNQGPSDNGFMVRADKFAISSPSLSGNVRYPFLVGFYNGQWRAIVDGNLMTDTLTVGSVSGSLQSSNWNGSSVGWKIDAAGNVTFNNGTFRGDVSASSITSSTISGSTVTASTLQTATSGKQIIISNSTNDIILKDDSENIIAKLGTDSIDGQPTTLIVGFNNPMTFGAQLKGTSVGVEGRANFTGVQGLIPFGTNTANASAVFGNCANGRADGRGVSGQASGLGTGVYGSSPQGIAVHGVSINSGTGVQGESTNNRGGYFQGPQRGVHGHCTSTNIGVLGTGSNIGVAAADCTWAFYGYNGNAKLLHGAWLTFTGAHEGLLDKNTAIDQGDILVDVSLAGSYGVLDAICINNLSSSANQPAIGVYVSRAPLHEGDDVIPKPTALRNLTQAEYDALRDDYDLIQIAAIGEGLINVCDANGDIAAGDLIVTCTVPGKGAKQADDVVRSYTVARARESVTWADEPETTKQIACIYLAG